MCLTLPSWLNKADSLKEKKKERRKKRKKKNRRETFVFKTVCWFHIAGTLKRKKERRKELFLKSHNYLLGRRFLKLCYMAKNKNKEVEKHFKNLLGKSLEITDKPILKIINGLLDFKLGKFIEEELHRKLKQIKNKKAADLDEIPPEIWKAKRFDDIVSDPKAPFSVATTRRCRGGPYSIPWIAPLYHWSTSYNAEC